MIKRHKLKNGLTLLLVEKDSPLVSINVTVKVGSIYETKEISGISHMIEHLSFDGTRKRKARDIAAEIEGIGGEISAYTGHEKTCFYVKAPKRRAAKAIDVLSDIIFGSTFLQKDLEKEKGIIISEMSLVKDQPRMHQWELLMSALYSRFPSGMPIAGTQKSVSGLVREQVLSYHGKYYVPCNMIVSVVGSTKGVKELIEKKFSASGKEPALPVFPSEPKMMKTIKKEEKRKTGQSYVVIGFHTVPAQHEDSYPLEVLRSVIGKPLSGRLFEEFRNKRSLAYDVGAMCEPGINFGFFAIYFSTDKKNVAECTNLALKVLKGAGDITEKELLESKNYIEGDFLRESEDSISVADDICEWEMISRAEDSDRFVSRIKKVTKSDIQKVIRRYFKNYAFVRIG